MKILDCTRNVSESSYTACDSGCCRSSPIHTRFIELNIVKYAANFKIIALIFGDTKPHLRKRSLQWTETDTSVLHCFHHQQKKIIRYRGSLLVVFDSNLQILLHRLKLQELRLHQLADSINKTTIISIELLEGWVPPHDGKRIVAIIGLPWNSAKVGILMDPGLRPKGRVVRTITKISAEVYFSLLHGREIHSILVRSCANEIRDNCGDPSIKWSKRCYGRSAKA